MRQFFAATLSAALAIPSLALAADPPTDMQKDPPASKVSIDTTIPENPGFAVIALTPTNVIDPSAMRISSINISDFVDDDGKLKSGLAAAGSPYFWLNRGQKLSEYQDRVKADFLTRAWSLTTVSAAFVRKQDGKPERIGLGFATELLGIRDLGGGKFDYADYRLDTMLADCIGDAYIKHVDPTAGPVPGVDQLGEQAQQQWNDAKANGVDANGVPKGLPPINLDIPGGIDLATYEAVWVGARRDTMRVERNEAIRKAEVPAAMTTAVQKCRADARERHARRQSLVVAGGMAVLPNPRPGEDSIDGGSLWAAYRRPFGTAVTNYLTLFARHDFDRRAEVPGGFQGFEKSSAAALLGYERDLLEGNDDGLARISFQAGYERLDYHGAGPLKDEESAFYALTVDYRISKNTYVEVKGGQGSLETGGKGKADKITFSIRHSLQ